MRTMRHEEWTPARWDHRGPARRKDKALAPSQHLRTTSGRTRISRLALPTALVLVAALTLSGCGAQQTGAAAIVGDTVISDKDVQNVSDQINTFTGGGEKQLTLNTALLSLILAPFVLAEAERAGKTVAPSQARQFIAKVVDPSAPTIEFVQMQLEWPQLDQTSQARLLKALEKVKVTVNPRYGTLDPTKPAISAISPNWIKTGAAPAK